MKNFAGRAAMLATVSTFVLGAPVWAVDLNLMISDVDGKASIVEDFAKRFQEANPDISIKLNVVGYNVIREQLAGQLEAKVGPDMAFVTNLGGLNPYYIDLTPYVDATDWEAQYGGVLPWYRAGKPGGIYGFQTEMTVTGPFINRTLFDEAGVDIPPPGATWEDWAEATREVKDNQNLYAGMVMDRSGHRFAGPAMSYGAKYYDKDGNLIVDEGFRIFAEMMIGWQEEELMPPDIWPAVSGSKYANGNDMFFNEEVPFYMSGSWNTANVQKNVGDKFDWAVVPVPCGPDGCGVMPGGTGLVAFDQGQSDDKKAAAGKFIAWMGEKEIAREWYGRTFAIPARADLQAEGIDYTSFGATKAVSDGLNLFAKGAAQAQKQTPQAFRLQGDPNNFVMFSATVEQIAAVMNGTQTMDEAMTRIEADLKEKANK